MASLTARSSRVSSGRTSRVPLGVGWIVTTPRTLRHRALDARPERAQALVDPLVAAVDLPDVPDLRDAVGAQGGDQHGHAGADVGRLHPLAAQPRRAGDDRAVRVAED